MTPHDPNYADELSEREARMLALIRSHVEARADHRVTRRRRARAFAADDGPIVVRPHGRTQHNGPTGPRVPHRRAPMLVGAAVLLVIAGAVAGTQAAVNRRPGKPTSPAAPVVALADLADVARHVPTPAAADLSWTITQFVQPSGDACSTPGILTTVTVPADRPPTDPVAGQLTVGELEATTGAAGCPTMSSSPRTIYSGTVSDLRRQWASLAASHPGMPTYLNPYAVDALFHIDVRHKLTSISDLRLGNFLGKQCTGRPANVCVAIGWSDVITLLTSPELTNQERGDVLAWAAADPDLATAATLRSTSGLVEVTVPTTGPSGSIVAVTLGFNGGTGRLVAEITAHSDGTVTRTELAMP